MKLKTISVLLILLLIYGCDNSTEPEKILNSITVTGTIENLNGTTLTEDMTVYVIWPVTATSPDYSYVWGKGTIDKEKLTFKVELSGPPPDEALNLNTLGVGVVYLINDKNLPEGKLSVHYDRSRVVGAAGWYSIIYKKDDNPNYQIDWLEQFKKGYSIGIGVEESGTFDSYKPLENGKMKLIIDELLKIKFVNWT